MILKRQKEVGAMFLTHRTPRAFLYAIHEPFSMQRNIFFIVSHSPYGGSRLFPRRVDISNSRRGKAPPDRASVFCEPRGVLSRLSCCD